MIQTDADDPEPWRGAGLAEAVLPWGQGRNARTPRRPALLTHWHAWVFFGLSSFTFCLSSAKWLPAEPVAIRF